MMRSTRVGVAIAVALGGWLASEARASDLPIDRGIGRQLGVFKLDDVLTGKPLKLTSFIGKKALVVVFMGTECPVGNLFMPRVVELAKEFGPKGAAFVLINANAHETADEVAAHARSFGVDFPVLKDPGNVVADQVLAQSTCETLVADGQGILRYRGAIDDQYSVGGKRRENPEHRYLVDAIEALLAGRDVPVRATEVAGCPIDRVDPKPPARDNLPRVRPAAPQIVEALKEKEGDEVVDVGQVTYAADVAPIVQAKCQSCHRPGQSGPFSLLTYDQTRRWAASIRDVIDERRMPPWHADPRYGHFENDRSLSPRQRAILMAWVAQGTPLGAADQVPPAREFVEGWSIGKPDLVFELPETYVVAAQGVLPYQYFRVPTGFTEDRWVTAAEARPGDASVVHHVLVFVVDPARAKDRRGGRGLDSHIAGYAPGDLPTIFPPGTAKRIPAGSELIFQVHYTPNGKVKTDRSRVGFIFTNDAPAHEARTIGVAQRRFLIPAGAENHEVKSRARVTADCLLLSFLPHMHLRGKDFLYKATYPDGTSEVLLSVPAYDFGWQSMYRLAEPKRLPKGTQIDCLAHFDNSENNPANPNPKEEVRWGEQTFEEMMIGYIDYSVERQDGGQSAITLEMVDESKPAPAPANTVKQTLGALLRAGAALGSKPAAEKPVEGARANDAGKPGSP
ncbi:MAG TPA: redoxin domain-containing protein [Isosphaeraceae bacterium]|nr:redoxin domain-containing protein [Isosphaeraceae bacterium]